MGIMPLKTDGKELRAVVETGGPRPTLTELILRRPLDAAIDVAPFIVPRSGPSNRPPPDFD